ncbi:hypothetical protein D3C84_737810 [compost metagenome]
MTLLSRAPSRSVRLLTASPRRSNSSLRCLLTINCWRRSPSAMCSSVVTVVDSARVDVCQVSNSRLAIIDAAIAPAINNVSRILSLVIFVAVRACVSLFVMANIRSSANFIRSDSPCCALKAAVCSCSNSFVRVSPVSWILFSWLMKRSKNPGLSRDVRKSSKLSWYLAILSTVRCSIIASVLTAKSWKGARMLENIVFSICVICVRICPCWPSSLR